MYFKPVNGFDSLLSVHLHLHVSGVRLSREFKYTFLNFASANMHIPLMQILILKFHPLWKNIYWSWDPDRWQNPS